MQWSIYLYPMLPKKLQDKIEIRKANNTLRQVVVPTNKRDKRLIDFSSNDYLGLAANESIFQRAHQILVEKKLLVNGATGSRLLVGNHILYEEVEKLLSENYKSEAALVFNSGYDANIGFFSAVPQRGDIILYDEFIHASIRDGIQLSNAKAFRFEHNNMEALSKLLEKNKGVKGAEIYVVTESVFSMDGDSPDLLALTGLCETYGSHLIVDEAHAIGVFEGGLLQQMQLENAVFARIITFGKAMGCHGAAVLGSELLKEYLVNFARSLIYTTALPPHALATIKAVNEAKQIRSEASIQLQKNIDYFMIQIAKLGLQSQFMPSNSAIHCAIIPGNKRVKQIAALLQDQGFDVKAILAPTVVAGQERLRICLHAFNSKQQIDQLLQALTHSLGSP
jgi:8-amino-7-oxononanoate synthase